MKNLLLFAALVFSVQAVSAQDVIDIAVARTMPEGEVVTVTGTVTNGQELGSIRYYQDATGAFAAFSPDFGSVSRHDSITITGEISFFNGLKQISPVTDFTNHGPADVQIEPTPVTLDEIGEETESLLVFVENCVFADGGASFTGNTTYAITSGAAEGTVFTRNDNPLVGSLIPVSPVDMVAVSSQFSFSGEGGYQILPRDADDVTSPNPINIISAVTVSNLTENGFTINWVTDVPSTTEAYYTPDLDGEGLTDNFTTQAESVTEHTLVLDNLEPGEVYFTRVFSVAEQDTAFGIVSAVATVSNSSGTIEAFFNASVEHQVAEPEDNLAVQTNLRDKVIEVIESAQTSVSMAGYNINDNLIVNALNAAQANGITVRYIAEDGNANFALNNISPDIPVLYRLNAMGSGMHNKFIIVDPESVDNSYVLTGSTNFTNNNLFTDPNNMVVIQDRSLAKAYTIEFNEMWGGSGPMFDQEASRFGPDKLNNTPTLFKIGGKDVELFFSPSDGTTNAIISALETTDASVEFSLLVFTVNGISSKLVELNDNFFIEVRGMINDPNVTGSEFDFLTSNFVQVLHHNVGALHHKYAIIDRADLSSDPQVITGSHNWSASANNVNDENTLIIHDADIANQFYQEWIARWQTLTLSTDENSEVNFNLFPNPAADEVNLRFSAPAGTQRIQITDLSGRTVFDYIYYAAAGENDVRLDTRNLPNGMYVLTLKGEWGGMSEKLVVGR